MKKINLQPLADQIRCSLVVRVSHCTRMIFANTIRMKIPQDSMVECVYNSFSSNSDELIVFFHIQKIRSAKLNYDEAKQK